MSTFTRLIRKRGAIKHKLTIFVKFLQPIKYDFERGDAIASKIILELQDRTDKFIKVFDEFEDVQTDLECTCDENDLDTHYAFRDEFTSEHSAALVNAKIILNKEINSFDNDLGPANGFASSPYSGQLSGIKLPTINLIKFNGSMNTWLEFKDTFESLIHNNNSIHAIQKYHYLRASLEGDALKVIHSLEFSAQNYVTAWELLCSRYNNSHLLVHNHVKSLFELEPITKETSRGIRTLIDNVYKHLRSLETLNQPVSGWDTLLIYMITSKLDKAAGCEWEKQKFSTGFPQLEDLTKFLKDRADWLEKLEVNYSTVAIKTSSISEIRSGVKRLSLVATSGLCNLCKQNHLIYNCEEFLTLNVDDRYKKIKDLNLCCNCLCKGHSSYSCRSSSCRKCKRRHNTLLHKSNQEVNSSVHDPIDSEIPALLANTAVNVKRVHYQQVLLATASIFISDSSGELYKVKALLDSGSMSNFITVRLSKHLKLEQSSTRVSIVGINGINSNLNSQCDVSINSTDGSFPLKISCFVLPQFDRLPLSRINIDKWNIPQGITLADPEFNVPSEINLLLGAGVFWNILKEGQISLGKNMPILQSTYLGWIISGTMSQPVSKTICHYSRMPHLDMQIKKFWELEDVDNVTSDVLTEHILCENQFLDTVSRNDKGRFVVRIPLKYPSSNLGDSKKLAVQRFLSLERKLEVNLDQKSQYVQFMKEYIGMNHMSPRDPDNQVQFSYFLPHHAVNKRDSLTTRLRVVFDGSAKTNSGWSLNDLQYSGPPIQNDMFSILIRFRQHAIVVCSDVAKMYRQILVHRDDRYLQNIVWRESPEYDLLSYNLNTVTYGTKSAPYLAIRCIKQLAVENEERYPRSSKIISRDFYVDDLITGFNSEQGAIAMCKEISSILDSACFPLRKWISNSVTVARAMEDNNEPVSVLLLGDNEQSKTLGICWYSKPDLLTYQIGSFSEGTSVSKRFIVSNVAKIYDPLGLVSPCIVLGKIIIQKLWRLRISWDAVVPHDLRKEWLQFRHSLSMLNQIKINRNAFCVNPIQIQIHGFCDASKNAYGACVFIRCVDNHNKIHVNLLCSKTKVAPLKSITIPRLELCSALLLVSLVKRVTDSLTINDIKCFYWIDSQVALCWIHTESKRLCTFIQNRVVKIQSLSSINDWRYINTKENPADLASRGVFLQRLVSSKLWWNGPLWLSLPDDQWPNLDCTTGFEIFEATVMVGSVSVTDFSLFTKFSSLSKLRNVVAYCLRFIKNCKIAKDQREVSHLSVIELSSSMKVLIKIAQEFSFKDEIKLLNSNRSLRSKHNIIGLGPFLDSDNLLRVGGRLENSQLNYGEKHPLLLSGKHLLTKLIFESTHKELMHASPQLLLATVRQQYWPTSGMSVAKKTVRNCVTCFRYKPKTINPIMAHLPKERVTLMHPFYISGIDYAGPFLLKDRKGRGNKTIKGYVCIFICFAIKAVHLELITDLTSESFLAGLRRFASRRGSPGHIWSDNGTNFVGSVNQLKLLFEFIKSNEDEIVRSCAGKNIVWHFIPPQSPHFGGLWEAGVKNIKFHLLRVIGNTTLTYEEFLTVLVQVEATLNSRPIHPLSSDPNDMQSLTPSHFLIGKSLSTVPDPDVQDIPTNRLSRFQLMQHITQCFWRRWTRDYLSTLQIKTKWKDNVVTLKPNTMVLIKQDNLPPCNWLLGRVLEVHPGNDGIVRVATIKTARGVLKRAVTKICPLPVPEEHLS